MWIPTGDLTGTRKSKSAKCISASTFLAFLLAIAIHATNIHDSVGIELVFNKMVDKFPCLKAILADEGYRGESISNAAKKHGWELKVVLRSDECPKKFIVLPKRWIVERTFS